MASFRIKLWKSKCLRIKEIDNSIEWKIKITGCKHVSLNWEKKWNNQIAIVED